MKKKVIELVRVSTEGQAAEDRASIPAQHAANRRTCAQHNLEIVESIEISDVSGASILRSPEMQRLLGLMESPEIHGVVAREFSRIMRPENFADYALLQAFVDTETILYLPQGPMDFSTRSGRLMGTIQAAIAGAERTEILERVWSAKEEKRRRGELAQSEIVLPWGVGHEEGRGFYYEPQAELVRDAYRDFLKGNHSYVQLSKSLGVTPRGMHLILRNPIYTGWRVIDKKRDPSPRGRYVRADGRQSDRRKIARTPDDVIRVKVIDQPLISEEEFQMVQRIMDQKQTRHWRSRPNLQRRFTYNGFLTCAKCGEVVHTALARRDYYACKGRRTGHTCSTRYMSREKLEAVLDQLFAERLTDPVFIENCVETFKERSEQHESSSRLDRLRTDLERLDQRRERVIEAFLDGKLSRHERDNYLGKVDGDIQTVKVSLAQETPICRPDTEHIVEAFAPLAEWKYWTRDQKRAVLSALTPDIRVADYEIESLGLNPEIFSNEDTRSGTGSWRRQA